MTAMPVLVVILCLMAIAYRYYSAFLAAKVATLSDLQETPALRLNDGQNYHPTNKWVLFGHHFAAISGAGPLIGPVLAAQFGYLPGLIWIVVGVCLGGAVQDFLVLVASIRRDGKSLAQIAYTDLGKVAGVASTAAILFILVVALAGLGKVVVKALGGEEVKYPEGSVLVFRDSSLHQIKPGVYSIPAGTELRWNQEKSSMIFTEGFVFKSPLKLAFEPDVSKGFRCVIPKDAARLVPGSSWGTFTIACTIPIALFVGLYMYRIRKGHVVEASLIGGALTLFATFIGGWVSQQPFGQWFNLKDTTVVMAMASYGFIASVLPVWVLLCPRDYLSSFLKIGTIALLVGGTLIANPVLEAPAINHVFLQGGPTVPGNIFPFLFITIMCGAISGFHSLVSSGTTPKMIKKETDARVIGYGAMLIEALVGVVAMIAAATLPVQDYYAMNTDLAKVPAYQDRILQVGGGGGIEHLAVTPAPRDNIEQYEQRTRESLRGRTGGAVTLAVGMAHIFDKATTKFWTGSQAFLEGMWKYWYHFAIMFEALFILTTIDTGTRVGRFLIQEVGGKIHPRFGQTDWWPGAIISTALMVGAWAYFINANSMAAIWPMFGVANQMLAVIALAIVSAYLTNEGKQRYLWVTAVPMFIVMITTSTAAVEMLVGQYQGFITQLNNQTSARNWNLLINSLVQGLLIIAMLCCALIVIASSASRCWLKQQAEAQVVNSFTDQ